MLKSSFSKYLTAFVIIILISFIVLAGIITSMIRTHITADRDEKLQNTCHIITDNFKDINLQDVEIYIRSHSELMQSLAQLAKTSNDFDVLITDQNGKIQLTTTVLDENELPSIRGDMGSVPINSFRDFESDSNGSFLRFDGMISDVIDEESMIYGQCILTDGVVVGYVFAVASTAKEDVLISITRKTVINGSVWVMLAAVIAAYFITDRIVHPLKKMTQAAKKFAKGDFSERLAVTGRDEVSELAVAFNNMAESLQNLESMRNSFMASVSHDLRTPMTTISGFIDGIMSGAIPQDQHEHYLGVISSEIHRLSRLVSQLLDISRLESGDRKFEFKDFDVAEVSRLILISFEQKIDEKRLNVEFNCPDEPMIVKADKDAIYQVIYNLCHNAIKFSKEEGRLVISLDKTQDKKIRISVYDQGQVVSSEDRKKIFERFYKTDKSRGLDKNGVGLGLYICKTIVDAHAENIDLIPRADGCEFVFTLKEGTLTARYK